MTSIDRDAANGRRHVEATSPIRIFIADSHPIVRYALRMLLGAESDFEVVGEASDSQELLSCLKQFYPDVLLLELGMRGLDRLAVLEAVVRSTPGVKVIAFTASEENSDFVRVMKLGCSGIINNETALNLIVKSVRRVHDGEVWLSSLATVAVMRQFAAAGSLEPPVPTTRARERPSLSDREHEIVQLVAQGFKNKEMGVRLLISPETVKHHLRKIFHKLGVSERGELALYSTEERNGAGSES